MTIRPDDDETAFVRLNHLSLTNFRNYTRLELALPDRLTVVQGANAQGKTNLLEAIHLLATGRSPRATSERELINWLAVGGPLAYARLRGELGEGATAQKVELVLELVSNGEGGPAIRKMVRVNGVPERALDLLGRLRVVLFLPEDISLVSGAPSERRRYLDISLCQVSADYCRALAEYNRVASQRNALLRRLREAGGDARQLAFWDARLVEHGSLVIQQRQEVVTRLDRLAAERHHELTGGGERLRLAYLPCLNLDETPPGSAAAPAHRLLTRRRLAEAGPPYGPVSPPPPHPAPALARDEIQERFLTGLQQIRPRELAAGLSLLGPHRDDMSFSIDGYDLRTYGSRGQQRTAALALKLAEMQWMQEATQESPLLLLDDVMSELDEGRRHTMLAALDGVAQAIVTTTDWHHFSPGLLSHARQLHVEGGAVMGVGSRE